MPGVAPPRAAATVMSELLPRPWVCVLCRAVKPVSLIRSRFVDVFFGDPDPPRWIVGPIAFHISEELLQIPCVPPFPH